MKEKTHYYQEKTLCIATILFFFKQTTPIFAINQSNIERVILIPDL